MLNHYRNHVDSIVWNKRHSKSREELETRHTVYVYRNIEEVCAITVAVEKQSVLQILSVRL
jgi:hypothetical protein